MKNIRYFNKWRKDTKKSKENNIGKTADTKKNLTEAEKHTRLLKQCQSLFEDVTEANLQGYFGHQASNWLCGFKSTLTKILEEKNEA